MFCTAEGSWRKPATSRLKAAPAIVRTTEGIAENAWPTVETTVDNAACTRAGVERMTLTMVSHARVPMAAAVEIAEATTVRTLSKAEVADPAIEFHVPAAPLWIAPHCPANQATAWPTAPRIPFHAWFAADWTDAHTLTSSAAPR